MAKRICKTTHAQHYAAASWVEAQGRTAAEAMTSEELAAALTAHLDTTVTPNGAKAVMRTLGWQTATQLARANIAARSNGEAAAKLEDIERRITRLEAKWKQLEN